MSKCGCWHLATSVITTLLLLTTTSAYSFNTIINASVLSTVGSNYAALYASIADILLREESTDKLKHLYVPNYCRLIFTPLIFDTSSGEAMFQSLERARYNFESRKVAVAVGPFMEVFASTDYVITQQTHILTSAAGKNAGVMDPTRVVSLLPEPSSLSQAISATVMKLSWNGIAFLAQDDFSPVLGLRQHGLKVWPLRLPNAIASYLDPELHRNLLELRQTQTVKYILHSTNRDVVMHVLKAANKLHLLHHTIDWFITYPDFEDLVRSDGQTWPGSLHGLQLLRQDKIPNNISHLLQGNISRLELGLAVDVVGLIRHILWAEWIDCSRERLVDNYIIPAEAFTWQMKHSVGPSNPYHGALGQYTWDKKSNVRTNFTIDILRYNNGVTKIGTIYFHYGVPTVTVDGLTSHHNVSTSDVFDRDEMLKIATRQTDPFIIKRGNNYTGFSHDLLLHLSEKIGFQFEMFEAEDQAGTNGGTVNGMVNALTTGNASMAVGALEVTAEREKVISFSYTILSSKASILIKKTDTNINFFQFLGPFSAGLWVVILLFMFVAGACLYVMSRYDPTQRGAIKHFDLKESLWYSLNIFLQGSTDYSPQTTAMRTIIAFFWFCVLIIEAAYTANLAAFLTLQQIDYRIKSVFDLADQTKMKYGVEKGSEIMHFFQMQKEDPYQRMWSIMKVDEAECVIANRTEILDKVKGGTLAFISDGVTNGYYANQHCGIENIEQNFQSKDFSIGLPRGAPYLDDINKALLELREEGVLDTLREKWWSLGKNCTDKDERRYISQKSTAELELTSMIGVFIVLAVFITIAVSVHIGERLLSRSRMKRTKNNAYRDERVRLTNCATFPHLNSSKAQATASDNQTTAYKPTQMKGDSLPEFDFSVTSAYT